MAITAGTTYVASYHSGGYYSANNNYFTSAYVSGALTAPANTTTSGNGVYIYGSGSSFPTSTHLSTNYWVDVLVQ